MTVSGQLKQTVASLNGTVAALQAMQAIEENKEERLRLERNSAKIQKVIQELEARVSKLEFEEPQYKGF